MIKNNRKKVIFASIILIFSVLATIAYFDFLSYKNKSVPIFAYHRVRELNDLYSMPPYLFEEQMEFLHKQGYRTISLKEFVSEKEIASDKTGKRMIITFDDGYDDNCYNAMPIMKKYGYKGTIFVAVKFMGWPGYVTWQDLIKLKDNGWEIGSHTWNHVNLTKVSDNELEKELKDSKKFLEEFLPNTFEVNTFSYPNGGYNETIKKALKKYGYIAAVTGDSGVNTKDTDDYFLYRVNAFHDGGGMEGFQQRTERAQVMGWLKSHGIDAKEIIKFFYY